MSLLLKVVAAVLLLLNLKSLPLAFHVRFYYFLVKHFFVLRNQKSKSLFEPRIYRTHTPMMEMDFNMHKSNSTYFSDLDMSRADLMMYLFKDFYLKYKETDVKPSAVPWNNSPLGAVVTIFRREIKPYAAYNVKSRVLGWDGKWLFVISRFESKGKLNAVALSKYVFKLERKTIAPETVIKFCNFASEENLAKGRMDFDKAEHLLNLEEIEHHHF